MQQEMMEALAPLAASGDLEVCTPEEEEAFADGIRRCVPAYFPYVGAELYRGRAAVSGGPPQPADPLGNAAAFLESAMRAAGVEGDARLTLLWDDVGYRALRVRARTLLGALAELLSQPAHLYVVPEDLSWCVCFRFEGDMGFTFTQLAPARDAPH
jgi:hypothetical protein